MIIVGATCGRPLFPAHIPPPKGRSPVGLREPAAIPLKKDGRPIGDFGTFPAFGLYARGAEVEMGEDVVFKNKNAAGRPAVDIQK
ncbi:MAG: hypothetical protein MJ141_01685 [Clostridia bacterium]|nr:hypothetical protein [Clostridia bacterium]